MSSQGSYKAALYLRLSKDDEGELESSSICTQRNILNEFAASHGINVINEYADDGYTGTNYNRPAFQQMILDIEKGLVNCVITKDLSRLGRNSAKTAELLDEYFPRNNVRYISVTEGYDSVNLNPGSVMAAPFMLLMNEMYARDISGKIKTSFRSKMENGEYIGSFAPYGYKKDTEHGNKNHLIPDCRVAHIVKKIFCLAQNGSTPSDIAQKLNDSGISAPSVYRRTACPYTSGTQNVWTSAAICKMLKNKVYLGCTQQGKTAKLSFKSKAVISKKEDEWITVTHTHEPLISEYTYECVRKRCVSRRHCPNGEFKNVFSGIAKCADCGKNMTTSPKRKHGEYNLCCGGYKSGGAKKCTNHFIDYDLLCRAVFEEICTFLSFTDDEKTAICAEVQKERRQNSQSSGIVFETEKAKKRILKITQISKNLYENFVDGKISELMYKKLSEEYENEYTAFKKTLDDLNEQAKTPQTKACISFDSMFDGKLTAQLLKKFVDKIEVEQGEYHGKSKTQKIRIYYNFGKE